MSLEQEVANLVIATTELTDAVNIKKSVLDDTVDGVEAIRDDLQTNWSDKLATAAQQANIATTQAGIATNKATEASVSATTAVNAKSAAEAARDAAILNSTVYPDEATGRAAVADGEYFKVIGSGDVAAREYQRTDENTSVLVAEYPSIGLFTNTPTASRVPSANTVGKISDGWLDLDGLKTQIRNALYPDGIYPFVDLRFVGATKISDPNVSFSRASKATYWDADGVLREAEVDEPRFDHDPVTGEALGLLRERSATNSAPNSSYLSAWIKTNTIVTQAGSYKGWPIWRVTSGSTTNAAARVRVISQIPAGDVTITVLARPALENTFIISGAILSTPAISWAYSTETNSFLSGGAQGYVLPKVVHEVKKLPDGFILLKFTVTIAEQGTELWLFANRSVTGVDNATDFVLIQVESGSSPSSYIPTGTSAATRAADIITYANADNSPLFPNREFSAVIDYDATALTPSADRISAYFNGTTPLSVKDSNTLDGYGNALPSLGYQTGRNKIAFAVDADRKSGSLNGSVVSESMGATTDVDSTTQISFSQGGVAQNYNGHLRSFQLYRRALPNNKLQELSQI